MTLGFGLFIDLEDKADWPKIIIFQIIAGLGVGPLFQAPLIALQNFVQPRDIASATATFAFIRNIATSVSVVIGSVVFQNEMNKKASTLVAALGPQLAGELSGGSAGASVGIVKALPSAQRAVARRAFQQSLRTMWMMYGMYSDAPSSNLAISSLHVSVAFAAAGLLVSLLIKHQSLSKEHQVTKTGLAEEEAKRKELQQQKRISRDEQRAEKEAMKRDARKQSGENVPREDV